MPTDTSRPSPKNLSSWPLAALLLATGVIAQRLRNGRRSLLRMSSLPVVGSRTWQACERPACHMDSPQTDGTVRLVDLRCVVIDAESGDRVSGVALEGGAQVRMG